MSTAVSLCVGQHVRVRELLVGRHARTPWYVQGQLGVIVGSLGRWPNPEICALGLADPIGADLYSVEFHQVVLWPNYPGSAKDLLVLDLYAHWLEPGILPASSASQSNEVTHD